MAIFNSHNITAAPDAYAPGLTYENYPALKEVYKDYFTLGVFGAGEMDALIYNYASFAPGNSMKPAYTQPRKGEFDYAGVDADFKKYTDLNPDILLYGHTLAWHSQSPAWLWDAPPAEFDQPGEFDYDTSKANLENHIENVLGYFGGQLVGVDVVNEAIGTAKPNDWKSSLTKGEGWYTALGWEWVEIAFVKAAEVVDANGWDCKLIYNDFGLDNKNKATAVYEMVRDINERYAGTRPNGKNLIEVIGMQAHYNFGTEAADVEKSIELFATLPGVMINITEMDIGCPPGELTPDSENNQAVKFAELFEIFKRYAAGPANTTDNPKVIDRVSICGVRDATSGWRAGEYALLFNSDGLAKLSLTAVLDPEAFLSSHEYVLPEIVPYEQFVDGVFVYDMARGNAYTGANIILGSDAGVWPWSTAGEDGKVAFTPEKDAVYRFIVNYTPTGTTGIRIRWLKDETNGAYTNADGIVVNDYVYTSDQTATTIPALFNGDMVNMGNYTLTTEFKMDGNEPEEGLIGNICVRGYQGGNAFTINWMKMETADGELIFNWDPNAPAQTEAEPEPELEPEAEPEPEPEAETTDNGAPAQETPAAAQVARPAEDFSIPPGVIILIVGIVIAGVVMFFRRRY